MTYQIYIDTLARQVVQSPVNSAVAALPPFVQGDTLTLQIQALQPTGQLVQPVYTIVSVAGLTMEVAIGTRIGSGNTIYAAQYAWTPDINNFFSAALALNTAAINTLLGTNQSASAWIEVKLINGLGVPTTILDQQITIQAAVIQNGNLTPVPPGGTAASLEYCNAQFLSRLIQGQIILESPDGTKKAALYLGDDYTLHCDPIP